MEKHIGQQKAEGPSQEHAHKSWQQRHGATIIAVVAALMLALLIGLQMSC